MRGNGSQLIFKKVEKGKEVWWKLSNKWHSFHKLKQCSFMEWFNLKFSKIHSPDLNMWLIPLQVKQLGRKQILSIEYIKTPSWEDVQIFDQNLNYISKSPYFKTEIIFLALKNYPVLTIGRGLWHLSHIFCIYLFGQNKAAQINTNIFGVLYKRQIIGW